MEKISVEIKAKYREYEFSFSEWDNEWSVAVGEEKEAYSNTDIKKVKEYVDKLIKNEFKPIKALGQTYFNDEIKEIVINSFDSQEKDKVWVMNSEGRRSKADRRNCFALTGENLAKIKQMGEIEKKIEELRKENEMIHKSLAKAL